MFSLDLKDAYFQIPIHPSSRKYLRLEFRNTVFKFRALPLGISTAPWLCCITLTKVMGVVKELFHRDGLSLFQYLDDCLGDVQTRGEARQRSQLHQNLRSSPSRFFNFLGRNCDMHLGKVFITEKNLAKAAGGLSQADQAPAPQWQSLVGTLQVQVTLIPLSQLKEKDVFVNMSI